MAHSFGDIDITRLLGRWCEGEREALDALLPLVYRELRRVARARLRGESARHSLQATALVHEVYLRLLEVNRLRFENRTHFFAVAARLMRHILVDHARRKKADKRGAGVSVLDIDDISPAVPPISVDVLALDRALEELATIDERLSRVVELRFFAGLTIDETATSLDVSPATVERDWTMAKAWLYDRMMPGGPPAAE
jgi:RNA polymerase sigma factor (TIGR02999 family)